MTDHYVVLQIAAIGSALYAIALLILATAQRWFVFQRYSISFGARDDRAFASARFSIATQDGESLDAVWLPSAGPSKVAMLYLHGNATTLIHRMSRIKALSALGFSVLALDWRGFGGSTGTPSQAGLRLDAKAGLEWLSRKFDLSHVVVLGESLGAAVAIELVSGCRVGALILEAPFSSAVDLAKARLPIFPIGLLMIDQFRSDLFIRSIRTPVLVQHGLRDRTIPVRFGKRLYNLANEPKQLILYPGGNHNNLPEKHGSHSDLKRFVTQFFDVGEFQQMQHPHNHPH
jgi:uncharacterized protein